MGPTTTDDATAWYFAYGSNMGESTFRGRRSLSPLAAVAGRLDDFALCFDLPIGDGERAVANLRPEAGARTHGVLYLLTSADCERLDRSEGVHAGLYDRAAVQVVSERGPLDAFTYISQHRTAARKPSLRYLGLLLEGARQHGLPADYVRFLETLEVAWDEREGAENPPDRMPPSANSES